MREQIQRLGGPGNWTAIAERLPGRSSKSCRLRWCNQLNPTVKRGPFTPEEDSQILQAHSVHGNKWAVISRSMPGRTDNQVKNRFNSTLRRTLGHGGGGGRSSPAPTIKAPKAIQATMMMPSSVAGGVAPSVAVTLITQQTSPIGSRKHSSSQLQKQASLKRGGSQILETTMSCDESMMMMMMETSQKQQKEMMMISNKNNKRNDLHNNEHEQTFPMTKANNNKRLKKSPTKKPSQLGKKLGRGPSQDREDSGGSESVGLETLIQASLLELQRIKSGKNASGLDKEYYTMNNNNDQASGGFGNINSMNINSMNMNNNNNNNNNTMSNMSDRTMDDPRRLASSMSMENLRRNGGFSSAMGLPNDSYDWRANSPVIGLPAFHHSLSTQLVRRPSYLTIASQNNMLLMNNNASAMIAGQGGDGQNANEMNDPRAGLNGLSTPVTITPNLASSWYGRMLENLGWRNHFPLDVLPMQEQEKIEKEDIEAHEKFVPIENGMEEEENNVNHNNANAGNSFEKPAATTVTPTTAVTTADAIKIEPPLLTMTTTEIVPKKEELLDVNTSPKSDNTNADDAAVHIEAL